MVLRLIAIVPKSTKILDVERSGLAISREMVAFGADMQQAMAKYPPQQPTTYRRTGGLGRGWQVSTRREMGVVVEVQVFNRVPYSPYVQGTRSGKKGERQTKVMRGKGWQNITTTSQIVWKRHRAGVQRAIRTGR